MPNGAAVRLPFAPEASTPAIVQAGKPAPPSEQRIGIAVAEALAVFCQALTEFQRDGVLARATRDESGSRIAELFTTLQQSTSEDWEKVARVEGRRVLIQRHSAAFRQCHGRDLDDAAVDWLLDELLAVVSRVSEIERALAH